MFVNEVLNSQKHLRRLNRPGSFGYFKGRKTERIKVRRNKMNDWKEAIKAMRDHNEGK